MTEYMAKIRELDERPELFQEAYGLYLAVTPTTPDACGYSGCRDCPDSRSQSFMDIVNSVHGSDFAARCVLCKKVDLRDNTSQDLNDYTVCDACMEDIQICGRCDGFFVHDNSLTYPNGSDTGYCRRCVRDCLTYCGHCDVYYENDDYDEHQHDVPCECSPQKRQFTLPANSHGTITADERLLVELPMGELTDEAIAAVVRMLWDAQIADMHPLVEYNSRNREAYYESAEKQSQVYKKLEATVGALERQWQTKRGNFTRRLSKALADEMEIKLNPGLLSRAGSTLKQHTSCRTSWYVEFTRNLNQRASAFYHEDSCWWSSENRSLCALKHWGGLGMRSYDDAETNPEFPTGRAWVQPLDSGLDLSTDALNAHAYVVYNGYGALEGYNAARLVAYLASRTYKRIGLEIGNQYVNSGGYLIADQATCDATSSLSLGMRLGHHEEVA